MTQSGFADANEKDAGQVPLETLNELLRSQLYQSKRQSASRQYSLTYTKKQVRESLDRAQSLILRGQPLKAIEEFESLRTALSKDGRKVGG